MFSSPYSSDLHIPHNTEPMMLGSPTSPVTQHSQSQYLPGFLLGESSHSHHALSPGPKMWTSPPRGASVHGRGSGSLSSPSSAGPTGITPRSDMTSPRAKDKLGAPPVKRLASDLGATPGSGANSPFLAGNAAAFKPHAMSGHMLTPVSRGMTSTPALQTPGITQSFNASTAGPEALYGSVHIPASPAQLDPFYTQGENLTSDDVLDDTWVTVFGFPPSATSFILQQFSQYGNIIKHTTSSDGNWMHLHYQSKIQAKKALSANGKVFGGSIMVGVSRCIDKSVMMEEDKENSIAVNGGCGSRFGTPNISRLHTSHLDTSSLPSSARNTPSIRPLTAAYQSARKEHEVVQSGNIPQKSNNIVSKAMEYVFGW